MLKFSLRGTLCCVAWLEAIESQLASLYQSLPRLYGRLNHTLQNIINCVVLMDLSINQINLDTHDPPSENWKCSHAWCIPSSSKGTGLFLCEYIFNVFARPKRGRPCRGSVRTSVHSKPLQYSIVLNSQLIKA